MEKQVKLIQEIEEDSEKRPIDVKRFRNRYFTQTGLMVTEEVTIKKWIEPSI